MNKFSILAIILFVFVCSCSYQRKKVTNENFPKKELKVSDTSDSWGADITLSITEKVIDENGNKTLTAVSSYNGQDVGFRILVLSTSYNDTAAFSSNRIVIKSLGQLSDNLIKVLSKLYDLNNVANLKFIDSLKVTDVNLDVLSNQLAQKENATVEKSNMTDFSTKLFLGNPDDENDYGEIYLNVSETDKTVELKEKDIDYRKQVIKAFSKK